MVPERKKVRGAGTEKQKKNLDDNNQFVETTWDVRCGEGEQSLTIGVIG